jgi:long-chain acyl-CoA synthetase
LPEKTAEVFDSDGWFSTGDVGLVYPNGTVKIIDRVKNIFKLSQGEYIAPEKLENIYIQSSYVAQILIHGDSTKNACVGIVVLEKDHCLKWAKQHDKT